MRRIPVLAIVLFLVSLGGVGVVYLKTRPPEPTVLHVDRVAQAVAATSSASTFTFAYSIKVSAAGESLAMNGTGSYDGDLRLIEMTLHVDEAPPVMPAGLIDTDVVVDASDGFVEYMRMPLLADRLPAGKTWVKIDVGKLAKKEGIDLGRLLEGNNADPANFFKFLREAATPAVVGHEKVGSVPTTHYRATVDLRRLVAIETDVSAREALERAMEQSGITSYPVEAWVDGNGYLRRMRVTLPLQEGSSAATMTMTEELASFGDPVSVAVPADASVVDVSKVAGFGNPAA